MKTYKVRVSQHWIEYGDIEIEAVDEDTARDEAREMLTSDTDAFTWDSDMEPQEHGVETVVEVI